MVTAMRLFQILSSCLVVITLMQPVNGRKMTLFNFKTLKNVENWKEISDTIRTGGKSKATLTLQHTKEFQRAVFFTLLNPQSNGTGFAGVSTLTSLNLSAFKNIEITCRGQGENQNYKVVLRHNEQLSNDDISYEQFFTVPISSETFSIVSLPLENFDAYYEDSKIEVAANLNTSNITMFGLQIYSGTNLPIKQKGLSALEIETINATS